MKVDDILTLIRAGYTKEDIEAMNQAPAEQPKPEPKPEVKKEEPKTPEPEAKPEPKPEENPVLKEMQELRKSIMKLAVVNGAAEIQDEKDKLNEALKKLIGG